MATTKKPPLAHPPTSFRLSSSAREKIGLISKFLGDKNRTDVLELAIEHEAMRITNRCVCIWSQPAMRAKPCKTCNGFGVVAIGIQTQPGEKPPVSAWVSQEGQTPDEALLAYVTPAMCPDCKGKGNRG